jgi:hypothetical protein
MDKTFVVALISGGISLVVTTLGLIFNPFAQRRLQAQKAAIDAQLAETKLGYDRDLSDLKARLDEGAAERKAQRDYEYEARKKLYAQIEPLMLQVGFAAENCFDRVANLALITGKGYLEPGPRSWLTPNIEGHRYYLDSTLYRVLLPLGFFEIVRSKTTQLDFKLEPRLESLFRVMRQHYRLWSAEFAFAEAGPTLAYTPYAPEAESEHERAPQRYRRQGVALGRVDKIAAAMVVAGDGGGLRVRRLGEFESEWASKQGALWEAAGPFYALFEGFRPDLTPVLWRILCAQACLAYAIRRLVMHGETRDAIAIVQDFCRDKRSHARFALSPDDAGATGAGAEFAAIEHVLVHALQERDLLDA